jgi:hypothetical protein
MALRLFCKHCRLRVGLTTKGGWRHFAGRGAKGCGRTLTRDDVRRVVVAKGKG